MWEGDVIPIRDKKKTVLLCGWEGYIGTALVQTLLSKGYNVYGIDNGLRRNAVEKLGSESAIDEAPWWIKSKQFKIFSGEFNNSNYDVSGDDVGVLEWLFTENKFDTVINLAHIPSAPYSQKNLEQSNKTLQNNIIGTNNLLWMIKKHCPNAHYITIGSTGEYSHYLNIDIEEGYFSFEHKGRQSEECLFPRKANSLYHSSKIASTYMIDYLAKTWGLRCTDVMQAVVFGSYTPECEKTGVYTRLDSDEEFGTVINRFVVQACLGEPLTIYGEGKHQRGFISLADSVQALMLAVENPPEKGTVQSWNQLSEWHSINDVAEMVNQVTMEKWNSPVRIKHIESPRGEFTGEHYYNYVADKLKDLGYKPTRTIKEEIRFMMSLVVKNLNNRPELMEVLKNNIEPKIKF